MAKHNTSDESMDMTILSRLEVSRNHLKMSICISFLLFFSLILPYFLKWYSEPSLILGHDLFFGLNRVWVPTQTLVLDETATDQTYISQISYNSIKLSTFLVNGCPTSPLPLEKCESYNSLQFASFCYLPLKLVS